VKGTDGNLIAEAQRPQNTIETGLCGEHRKPFTTDNDDKLL
jgi:hypothetical protein